MALVILALHRTVVPMNADLDSIRSQRLEGVVREFTFCEIEACTPPRILVIHVALAQSRRLTIGEGAVREEVLRLVETDALEDLLRAGRQLVGRRQLEEVIPREIQ